MVTIPVSASMYQTVVANIQQIHAQSDGTMQVSSFHDYYKVLLDGKLSLDYLYSIDQNYDFV